ncbi:MAG: polysaccharide biosynthesis/export family protein, partial [Sphingobium sp.]
GFCLSSAALVLPGCSSGGGSLPPIQTAAAQEYRLAPGDELRVFVYGLDAINNTYVVNDSGQISLPLIESVPATGKTVPDLERTIAEQLVARQIVQRPNVNVQPIKMRPFYILGEVRTPGEYAYRPGMSVVSAVSAAGGFTYRANQSNVSITRKVNGQSVTSRATVSTPILPGDDIRIFEKWF